MPNYANAEVTFWWVIIGVGFVVVLVAAALLQLLVSLVKDIDRGVEAVKATLAATALGLLLAAVWAAATPPGPPPSTRSSVIGALLRAPRPPRHGRSPPAHAGRPPAADRGTSP